MKVFGLDPSLTGFGWALHDAAASGLLRCVDKGIFKTPSSWDEVRRYTFLRNSVIDLLAQHPDVKRAALETPIFGETYSEGMYALFVFVQEALYQSRMDVVFLAVPQIKAHARESLGRPSGWKMKKSDMVEEAKRDTGIGRWNHNEADAYLASRIGARFWGLVDGAIQREDLTPYESKAFLKEHTFVRGKKKGLTERTGIFYRKSERYFTWGEHGNETND